MKIAFPPQRVLVRTRGDGARVYRSTLDLAALPTNANVALERGAAAHPTRAFIRARDARGRWETLTYAGALARARAIACGLRACGATHDRPLLVLAPNGIEHALVALGASLACVPLVPIGLEYARADSPSERFTRIVSTVTPAIAYVDRSLLCGDVARALAGVEIFDRTTRLEAANDGGPLPAATLDTVAKILFTSGSTGNPKGVIVTHRMIVSNQVAFAQIWPSSASDPPVLVDWLPWSHSFGGNKVFGLALHRGGTLVVDDGRPTASDFARTLQSLSDWSPTIYFGVPRSFALLIDALERDGDLRARFFSQLDFAFSAAAALPPDRARTFARLARETSGREIPLLGGWGATETAPGAICVHDFSAPAASLGVPLPGTEIALVSARGLAELRVRGPNVTPGYWREEQATRAAFDDDGFYRSGDAGALVDAERPERGFIFAGRLTEHFKLSSGAWVASTHVRERFLHAAAPVVFDVVITGADRDEVGGLVYLDLAAARAFVGSEELDRTALAAHPILREHIARALATVAAQAGGRAERIARATIVAAEPLATTGELTAKGTIARGVALRLRAATIAEMHDDVAESIFALP